MKTSDGRTVTVDLHDAAAVEAILRENEAASGKRAEAMADYIDDLLVWMRLSEGGKKSFWNPKQFDRAEPLLPEEAEDEWGFNMGALNKLTDLCLQLGIEERPLFNDITPLVIWPVRNVRVFPSLENGVYTFSSVMTASKKMRRDLAFLGVRGAHSLIMASETIHRTGERESRYAIANWSAATGWVPAVRTSTVGPAAARMMANRTLSDELAKRYEWSVDIKMAPDLTGLSLPTDHYGVEKLLAERDRPAGANRRPALRHWVTEHRRQTRRDPKSETKVREHLRGREQFTWCGYHCRIRPAAFDEQRAENAKERPIERRP